MNMPCAVTHDLNRYLDKIDAEDARAEALEAEFEKTIEDVPEQVAEVIRHWIGIDPKFSQAIDEALESILYARNAP